MPASDVIFGKVEAQLGLYIHTKFGDYIYIKRFQNYAPAGQLARPSDPDTTTIANGRKNGVRALVRELSSNRKKARSPADLRIIEKNMAGY